jgi:hypothetical protein
MHSQVIPCPRQGCPGIITNTHRSKGHTYCCAFCSYLEGAREKLLIRLERAETIPRYADPKSILEECDALDAVEEAFNAYVVCVIGNLPHLRRARREMQEQQGQEQAA